MKGSGALNNMGDTQSLRIIYLKLFGLDNNGKFGYLNQSDLTH